MPDRFEAKDPRVQYPSQHYSQQRAQRRTRDHRGHTSREIGEIPAVKPRDPSPLPSISEVSSSYLDGSGDASDAETTSPTDAKPRPKYRPIVTVDWRAELCRLIDVSPETSNDVLLDLVEEAAEKLKEVERLKAMSRVHLSPPRSQVMHVVQCFDSANRDRAGNRLYLDQPWLVESGPFYAHLRGSRPVHNFELYLERNMDVALVIYKHYECCRSSRASRDHGRRGMDVSTETVIPVRRETISIIAAELRAALVEISRTALEGIPYPDFDEETDDRKAAVAYPYMWYFYRQGEIEEATKKLSVEARGYMDSFRKYIDDRMMDEWTAVRTLLRNGEISAEYIKYLFVPDRIIVSQSNGKSLAKLSAFVAREWLLIEAHDQDFHASISVCAWIFDGAFHKTIELLEFDVDDLPSRTENFNICDLPMYPLEFAKANVVAALRNRGKMFWKCRLRKYVSYSTGTDDGIENSVDGRFMVDIDTYNQLHGYGNSDRPKREDGDNVLSLAYMTQDSPMLGDDFFMCLPTVIQGFNMQKKEWVNLHVHYMKDVLWNTAAFADLVIDQETKDLVQALVSNKLRASENTDLIEGKGNGLFILLHGGPGTGKTLTAESVAEVANRPLYRVTCGDIGTTAEGVEKYLDAVLMLGKTWGCVVLLDEADVFLEQRSLVNLERNALVSVFLRVLEYYDGILILTSNRVGIFDEAFKSRIQLNLRYKALDAGQRRQIWENFFKRLERRKENRLTTEEQVLKSPNVGVDTKSLKDNIEDLVKVELNGRQIRNSISTARELATFRGEPMSYKHLKLVMKETTNFDEYLLELNGNFTPDQIQRDKRER